MLTVNFTNIIIVPVCRKVPVGYRLVMLPMMSRDPMTP